MPEKAWVVAYVSHVVQFLTLLILSSTVAQTAQTGQLVRRQEVRDISPVNS